MSDPRGRYKIEDARRYWQYPPCKAFGKQDTAGYCNQSDDFIRNLIEQEIRIRGEKEQTSTYKERVSSWIEREQVKSILDFGSGLGQEGLYFAKTFNIRVVLADIVPSNVALASRFSKIWNVNTSAVLVDVDPESFKFEERFDLIFSNGVLHHSPHATQIVKNLATYLKYGGLFISMLYTRKHFENSRAEDLEDYANKSEARPPVALDNPHSEYYDLEKAKKLFARFTLLESWNSNNDLFGWYCFRKTWREIGEEQYLSLLGG